MLLEAANRREEVFIKKTRGDFCSNYSVLTNPTTTLRNRQRMNVMGGGEKEKQEQEKKELFLVVDRRKNFGVRKLAKFHAKYRKQKKKKKERTVDFVRWNGGSDIARDVRDFLDNENGRRGSVMWLTKVSRFERFSEPNGTLRPVFILLIIVIYRSKEIDDDSTGLCVRVWMRLFVT